MKKKALKQLKALRKKHDNKKQIVPSMLAALKKEPQQTEIASFRGEITTLCHQSVNQIANQLLTPLNPLVSWFQDGSSPRLALFMTQEIPSTPLKTSPSMSVSHTDLDQPSLSLARVPMKSPPCKRCPALSQGICKCAAKKMRF